MIEFFLIVGFIVGLMWWSSSKSSKMMPKSCDQNPDDRKHKWVIRFENGDRKGYLICKTCGKIPGED